MLKWNVDESANGGYNIVLGQYLLTQLGLNLIVTEKVIKADDGTFRGFTTPMVDLGKYIFKY